MVGMFFFFSSRRRHTRFDCDWSSDVCSSDLRVAGQRLGATWLERGLNAVARGGFISAGLAITIFPFVFGSPSVSMLLQGLSVGIYASACSFVLLQRRRDVDTEFWSELWAGRFGRCLFNR